MSASNRLITVKPSAWVRSEPHHKMGNTVGSLSEVQHSIVMGTLLGDGAMRCKTNALLEINHSSHQQSYVEWKYRHLADLVATPPKVRNGNGGRTACRFVTRSLPVLTPYFHLFYGTGKKQVPDVELSSLALAVWFMDDGCKSRNAVYLNTQQFDQRSQERLLRALRDQWGIEAALNKDKSYRRIRVSVDGTVRLAALIEPHLLPELRYKLPQVTP
jgi:LAGLIDADG DNA endonuclease family